jgi:4,5-DOPA dioxygenase extradiol
MDQLPTLFVSHGAPSAPITASPMRDFLAAEAARLGRPRAILIVSAHYLASRPTLTAHPQPTTIHDFYGFPEPLYALRYPAPGDPGLARAVAERLTGAGIPVDLDAERGLDHGAWTPLMTMYPAADIPVVQLSLVRGEGTGYHYRLGQALRGLAREGILVVGSGGISHNLRALDWGAGIASTTPYPWVSAFTQWMAQRTEAGDAAALLDYRAEAPDAARNHPTEDHLLPFYVALGASETGRGQRIHAGVEMRALGMDAYAFV